MCLCTDFDVLFVVDDRVFNELDCILWFIFLSIHWVRGGGSEK